MSKPTQPALFQPSVDDSAIVHVATAYGELLADVRYSAERKEKLLRLRKYAQALTGAERDSIAKFWPDLFTPNTPAKQ